MQYNTHAKLVNTAHESGISSNRTQHHVQMSHALPRLTNVIGAITRLTQGDSKLYQSISSSFFMLIADNLVICGCDINDPPNAR